MHIFANPVTYMVIQILYVSMRIIEWRAHRVLNALSVYEGKL